MENILSILKKSLKGRVITLYLDENGDLSVNPTIDVNNHSNYTILDVEYIGKHNGFNLIVSGNSRNDSVYIENIYNAFNLIEQPNSDISKDAKFKVGDLVDKKEGYSFPGIVDSVFYTQAGHIRYVVELHFNRMLHIFSEKDLKLSDEKK